MAEQVQTNQPQISNKKNRRVRLAAKIGVTKLLIIASVTTLAAISYTAGYSHGLEVATIIYEGKTEDLSRLVPSLVNSESEVKALTGTITEITSNSIIFEATKPAENVLESGEVATYTAKISSSTEYVLSTTVIEKNEDGLPLPKTTEKEITKNDLETGETVTFTSEENLRDTQEFTATKIIKTESEIPFEAQ